MELQVNNKEITLQSLRGTERKIVESLFRTYEGVGENNTYLETTFIVYKRMYNIIKNLPVNTQLDIISEATQIGYDGRISGFNHMNGLFAADK